MKTLPKSLYAKIEKPSNDEPFLIASADMSELNIDVGDKTKIGLYKLVGIHDAEGIVKTSKMRAAR